MLSSHTPPGTAVVFNRDVDYPDAVIPRFKKGTRAVLKAVVPLVNSSSGEPFAAEILGVDHSKRPRRRWPWQKQPQTQFYSLYALDVAALPKCLTELLTAAPVEKQSSELAK